MDWLPDIRKGMIIMMKKDYSFQDFVDIIHRLRAKDGCPWDREQTHSSLKQCMIEEAYEVVEGIERYEKSGDYTNLREELGDVLLQVVMHSQIAKEEGIFTMQDVIDEVSKKMINRHPHVFGTVSAENSDEVLKNWEEIKKKEKQEKKEKDNLHAIPKSFPPMMRANKVIKKAEKLYHTQEKEAELISSMSLAIDNLRTLSNQEDDIRRKKQIGSLLFTIAKLSRSYQVDTDEALSEAIDDYIGNYEGK